MAILVGTSGYVYSDWRRRFYPRTLAAGRWLPYYAQVFRTLELNATFYRLPTLQAAERWREQTPAGFRFAAKGSRFLTHMKRLTDVGRGLDRFFAPLEGLGSKLAVVLWQLPPQMSHPDPERLDRFLSNVPGHVRHAFEFRHAGWYIEEICDVLDRHGVAFVEHDAVAQPPPRVTGGFRYLRFHGASAPYLGRYGARRLRPWAIDLRDWDAPRRSAFVYFNNDRRGHAVLDALDLLRLLQRPAPAHARVRAEEAAAE